jgi:hypothetical protein
VFSVNFEQKHAFTSFALDFFEIAVLLVAFKVLIVDFGLAEHALLWRHRTFAFVLLKMFPYNFFLTIVTF